MVDLVSMGETMIQLNAVTSGPLRYVNSFEKHAAGTESNVAVGMVRMGYSAGWISKLGDDELGRYIHGFLRGEGVDVSKVKIDSNAPTGLYFVQRDFPLPGKSVIYYYRKGSAASRLTPEDVDEAYIASAKIFHTTGVTLALSESCRKTVDKAIEIAHNSKVQVSFDTNIRLKLWSPDEARRVILPYLSKTDTLFTDIQDSEILVGEADPASAAKKYLDMGIKTAVVKMGDKGAYVANKDGEKSMGIAFKVPVVDVTGAGDAFDAAFLSCRMRGMNLDRSIEFANATGALCVTVRGDVEAIPTTEDVKRFISGSEHILR
jgi:2-dehydro-3-deoxygluconokinase